jgi:hypothetical protein
VAFDVVPGAERIHQLRGRCRSIQESIWRPSAGAHGAAKSKKSGPCQKIVGDAVCAYSTVLFHQNELHASKGISSPVACTDTQTAARLTGLHRLA